MPASNLILNFQSPELQGSKGLLFKPPGLWGLLQQPTQNNACSSFSCSFSSLTSQRL